MPGDRTDFDDLLRRLGAADADPPPLMKKLLDEQRLKSSPQPDRTLLAELEAWLSLIEEERRSRTVS
jgi:hypothetical protein